MRCTRAFCALSAAGVIRAPLAALPLSPGRGRPSIDALTTRLADALPHAGPDVIGWRWALSLDVEGPPAAAAGPPLSALGGGRDPGAAPERLVGLVIAGSGRLHLDVEDPDVALALANRLVSWAGADRAVGAQLVAGGGVDVQIRRLLLVDPGLNVETRPLSQPQPDRAAELLALWNGRQALTLAELRPDRTVGWDRLRVELLGEDAESRRSLLDAWTDQAWVALEADRGPGGLPDDRWLTVASDPLASLDGRSTAFVTSAGLDGLGRPARQALFTVAGPAVSADPAPRFTGEIRAAPGGMEALDLGFDLRLALPAVDRPRPTLLLRLPQEGGALQGLRVVAEPAATALPLGETARSHWLALVFDSPVPAGEPVAVQLSWTDRWPLAGHPAATGPRRFLPGQIPDRPGSPAAFDLALQLAEGLEGAGTGRLLDGGPPRLRSESPVAFPRLAIGRWRPQDDPSAPALRLLWGPPGASILVETARLMALQDEVLGPGPGGSLDLVGLPPGRHAAETHGGLVALQPGLLRDLALRRPRPEATAVLAHELAHLRFGQQVLPASLADQWISEVLAEISAEAALQRAGAAVDGAQAHRIAAARLPPCPDGGLGGGESAAALYHLGPVALGRGLRARIGPTAHAAALRALAQQPELDTAAVQAAFEAASSQDLSAFFSVWVHGGQVPELSATWRRRRQPDGRQRVEGTLRSDRVFGRLEVPVGLVDRRGQLLSITWVTLVDGLARLDLEPVAGRRPELVLDPEGWLPLRQGRWERGPQSALSQSNAESSEGR